MRQTINRLQSGIIAHREWPWRQWLSAEGRRYYHRLLPTWRFRPNRPLYERMDPDLRELCRLLHGRGLRTTPSCQGHFHGRDYFLERWEELKREEVCITGGGLPVEDSETGRHYLFRDPGYRVPWKDFDGFYRESASHQITGYLGIIFPPADTPRRAALMALKITQKTEIGIEPFAPGRGDLLHILVRPDEPEDRSRQWLLLTERLLGLLSDEGATRSGRDPGGAAGADD